ncbi:hypothetical protein N0V94_001130 [Neodidymelliopsis sp. IMI 364377]|nr:hypothetical protein N0V94_001130 [Neodidymelliopsis sp. IMI 364377]
MSTQWDAANPTSSNGVTDQMLLNYERQARAAKLPPITIEDIEQEMLAVAAGRSQLSYNLQSAATADQLRNWVAIIQGDRRKAKKQPSKGMEGASEGMNFLSIATSVNAVVPNPASGVHAIVRFIYERKMLKQIQKIQPKGTTSKSANKLGAQWDAANPTQANGVKGGK